ncbi:hypothetical protein J6590_034487 [Homalodisca vitripennis]|uniref:Phospholipase A2-like domain-containing protein n=1 Tax=Homalodisca liturata TaxID=320908 RepID=A0A1B6IMH0_9HEMI|nr:hypothetical protein J6590_034487 [Homalodisca vitripennis]
MSNDRRDYSNLESCDNKCQLEKMLLKNFTDFTLPGFHYLGPGSRPDSGPPTNAVDAIAQRHDEAYDKAVRDFHQSHNVKRCVEEIEQADQRFLEDMSQVPVTTTTEVLGKAVGLAGIGLKTAVEKSLGFTLYPQFEEKDDYEKNHDESSSEDGSNRSRH